jgi:hypothetical protein
VRLVGYLKRYLKVCCCSESVMDAKPSSHLLFSKLEPDIVIATYKQSLQQIATCIISELLATMNSVTLDLRLRLSFETSFVSLQTYAM